MNPTTVRPGKDLAVRLYYAGVPQDDAEVTATGPGATVLRARSAPTGVAVVRIAASGDWTVGFRTVRGGVTYEATLSFNVLGDAAWQPTIEGGL